jgi:hypothetical protein
MSRSSVKAGDRAIVLLCVWGVACLGLDAFMKLWVRSHQAEYAAFVTTGPARVLSLVVIVLCILACPLGVALAIRGRRYWSVRIAAVVGSLGYIAMLASWLPGWLQASAQPVMGLLYWLTLGSMVVVVLVGIAWLVERRGVLSLFESSAP